MPPSLKEAEESHDAVEDASSDSSLVASSTSSSTDVEKKGVEVSDGNPETRWKNVWIAALISFLNFLLMYTLNTSAFVYLNLLDPEASVNVQGFLKAIVRAFTGLSCAGFAIHAYSRKVFRTSLLAGGFMLLASIVLYLFIEAFPLSILKYVWVFIFMLHAAVEGANTVLVSYIPRVSSQSDRVRAYAIFAGAEVVGIVLGPIIQFVCTFIPGQDEILGLDWLKMSQFTIPIWICGILSVVNLFIVFFVFEEPPADRNQKTLTETRKQAWKEIKTTDTKLLIICIWEKCTASFGCTTILTLAPPYIVATFNMDPSGQNKYSTVFQLVTGLCALFAAGIFAATPLARIKPSRMFLSALCFFIIAYFFSIPAFNFYSQDVTLADDDNPYGCNSTEFEWCQDFKIVTPWVWILFTGALLGIAFPQSNIAHDTIYSQILGGIDQNVMQGLLTMVVNLGMIPVPILATQVFIYWSPTAWWIIVEIAMGFGLLLWLCSATRLNQYIGHIKNRDEYGIPVPKAKTAKAAKEAKGPVKIPLNDTTAPKKSTDSTVPLLVSQSY